MNLLKSEIETFSYQITPLTTRYNLNNHNPVYLSKKKLSNFVKQKNNLAYLLLILTTIFWSGNFIVGKAASMFQIPPFSLNFYRLRFLEAVSYSYFFLVFEILFLH